MSATGRLARTRPTDIGVPGPTPFDMARAFSSIRADPLTFLTDTVHRFGDLTAFPVPGPPVLLVNDPADARHVLQTAARNWGKQTIQYAALARVTGPGLLASSEPTWITHRRIAAPAFHHHRLAAVGDQVRAAADAAITGRLSQTERGAGHVVDVSLLTHRIALDAVGKALFAADLSDQARQLLDTTSDAAELVVRAGRAIVPTPKWAPTPTNLRLRATRRRFDTISAGLITARRRQGRREDGTHGQDLLGLLVDSGLTDDQIRHELVTMIIAGHETVAAALAWTLMLLAEHPSNQDDVRTELSNHTGPVSLLNHRDTLPATRSVIDEALRLYPPAWALSRRARHADVVGGREVPAGTVVIISPWLLHRRTDTWWPDPLTFRPERFLDPVTGSATGLGGYLPFGQGARLCIGKEFALGEMVVVLDRLLRSHRFAVPPNWVRPTAQARVAVHPVGGMPLVVTQVRGAARG